MTNATIWFMHPVKKAQAFRYPLSRQKTDQTVAKVQIVGFVMQLHIIM